MFWLSPCVLSAESTVRSLISTCAKCKTVFYLKVNLMANSNKSDCFVLVCTLYVSSQSLFLPVRQKSGDFTKITYFQWFTKRGKKYIEKKDVCNHVELTTKCVFWVCLFVCFGRGGCQRSLLVNFYTLLSCK